MRPPCSFYAGLLNAWLLHFCPMEFNLPHFILSGEIGRKYSFSEMVCSTGGEKVWTPQVEHCTVNCVKMGLSACYVHKSLCTYLRGRLFSVPSDLELFPPGHTGCKNLTMSLSSVHGIDKAPSKAIAWNTVCVVLSLECNKVQSHDEKFLTCISVPQFNDVVLKAIRPKFLFKNFFGFHLQA